MPDLAHGKYLRTVASCGGDEVPFLVSIVRPTMPDRVQAQPSVLKRIGSAKKELTRSAVHPLRGNQRAMKGHAAVGPIEGIVLDAVGTLIEPHPPVAEAYAQAAERQGVTLETTVVRARFREFFRRDETSDQLGSLETNEVVEYQRWRRIVTSVLAEVPDPEQAFRELWQYFGTSEAWRCFGDVVPLLDSLRAEGLSVCIASNFDSRLRNVVSGLSELRPLSEQVVISSEVGYRKPHPAFYEAVETLCGIPAEKLLSVGDDVENDVLGALRSGLRGVWLDRGGNGQGENPPRIADLGGVLSLLKN